jgi:transposase
MSKRKRYSPEYKRELSKVIRERDFLNDAAAYFAKQSPSGTR